MTTRLYLVRHGPRSSPVKTASLGAVGVDLSDEGLLKLVVRKGTDRILGATLVARNAGDMISELTLAIGSGGGLRTLAETIHPYPTQAEILKRAGDAWSRTRLTPRVKRLFETLLAWRR